MEVNHKKYVTLKQAKLFKEKGFNEKTSGFYNGVGILNGMYHFENSIPAPEQWEIVEWLRINHNLWVQIEFGKDENSLWFNYYIYKLELGCDYSNESSESGLSSPQEAYLAAFDYVLENLI